MAFPALPEPQPVRARASAASEAAAASHGRCLVKGLRGEARPAGVDYCSMCWDGRRFRHNTASWPAGVSSPDLTGLAQTSAGQVRSDVASRRSLLRENWPNGTLSIRDQGHLCRRGQHRVHPQRGDRPVRLPRAPRRPAPGAARHQRGPAGVRRAAGRPDQRAVRRGRDRHRDRRPAGGAGRRRLRDQRGPGRRVPGHQGGFRHPGQVRRAPDHRRHDRHRRHLPRPAHHPGGRRAGRRHARRSARTPTC